MLAFTHEYRALPTPLSSLSTLDELRTAIDEKWLEVLESEDYRLGDKDRRFFLKKLTINRMTTWRIGYRLQRNASWLFHAVKSGEAYHLDGQGYPDRIFCRGELVLPQLEPVVMTDLVDSLHPAALPKPQDWVYVEQWDQS